MIETVRIEQFKVTEPGTAEMSARAQMRRQIERLEQKLSSLVTQGCQGDVSRCEKPSRGDARLIGLRELEEERDRLIVRLLAAEAEFAERCEARAGSRALLDAMIADPAAHKWIRVSNQDLGRPGCRHWHSTPRFGVLGMLFGWWRVKISSGCP